MNLTLKPAVVGWHFLAARYLPSHSLSIKWTGEENKIKILVHQDKSREIPYHLLSWVKETQLKEKWFNLSSIKAHMDSEKKKQPNKRKQIIKSNILHSFSRFSFSRFQFHNGNTYLRDHSRQHKNYFRSKALCLWFSSLLCSYIFAFLKHCFFS